MADKKNNQPPQRPQRPTVIPPAFRVEDFVSDYSNNCRFESTVYDLRMIFGQTDLEQGFEKEMVRQHTAITIPWAFAKVFAYYLHLQIYIQEAVNGKVVVPSGQLPAEPPPPPDLSDPNMQRLHEGAKAFRKEYFSRFFK
jgi:hypothetical protein